MKKIFLTSALCMITAMPAFAVTQEGYIQQTPTNDCVESTLGVSSGTASLEADWSANEYSCPAGQYLRASDATCQTCPSGSYCEGFSDETFNDEDIGKYSCRDDNSEDFPYSATGTSTGDLCYNTGDVACAQLNKYTGGHGTATYASTYASYKSYSDWGTPDDLTEDYPGGYFLDTIGACAITSLNCDAGYTATQAGPLANYVPQPVLWSGNTNIKYRALNGDNGSNSGNNGQGSHTGMQNGEWSVAWGDNTTVHGMAKCSDTTGTYAQTGTPSNTDGRYCWCDMTGYNLQGGTLQSVASPSWVFNRDLGSASNCANACANRCADYVQFDSGFRAALFGGLGANPSCQANDITLNWYNGNTLHDTNTCVYDSSVTLPSTEPTKTGYTFQGWKVRSGN